MTYRQIAIFWSAGSVLAILVFLFLFRFGALEQLTTSQIAIATVLTSLFILAFLESIFGLRKISYAPQLSNVDAVTATDNFLNNIKSNYGITWSKWLGSDIAIGSDSFTGSALALNSVDVPKYVATILRAESFHESGPERTAVKIFSSQGTLRVGRKKFHLMFTERELRALRHEVNLHSSYLELTAIRRARRNHLTELETLTEQRRARLQTANQAFLEKLQKRARFFKLVAQELRTPLNLVASAVHQGSIQVTPSIGKTLTDSTDRLLDLTSEIQTLASNNLDTPLIEWIKIDMICADLKERYRMQCSEKNLTLHLIGHPANTRVAMKQVHLEEILDNLITNATKYSPKHSTITATLRVTPGRLLIAVADEGSGVSPDEQALIFEPFFRTVQSRSIKGSGLGLAIVKRLATTYQGTVKVYNRTPHGAVFEVDVSVRTDVRAQS